MWHFQTNYRRFFIEIVSVAESVTHKKNLFRLMWWWWIAWNNVTLIYRGLNKQKWIKLVIDIEIIGLFFVSFFFFAFYLLFLALFSFFFLFLFLVRLLVLLLFLLRPLFCSCFASVLSQFYLCFASNMPLFFLLLFS